MLCALFFLFVESFSRGRKLLHVRKKGKKEREAHERRERERERFSLARGVAGETLRISRKVAHERGLISPHKKVDHFLSLSLSRTQARGADDDWL